NTGHSAIVDTGSSLGILPDNIWSQIYSHAPGFPTLHKKENGEQKELPMFNLTNVSPELIPTMALRIGDIEWMAELGTVQLNVAEKLGFGSNQILTLPSFLPAVVFQELFNVTNIPSILGSPFWSNLKGMVFDFNPGRERVGFVPRKSWTNKS